MWNTYSVCAFAAMQRWTEIYGNCRGASGEASPEFGVPEGSRSSRCPTPLTVRGRSLSPFGTTKISPGIGVPARSEVDLELPDQNMKQVVRVIVMMPAVRALNLHNHNVIAVIGRDRPRMPTVVEMAELSSKTNRVGRVCPALTFARP